MWLQDRAEEGFVPIQSTEHHVYFQDSNDPLNLWRQKKEVSNSKLSYLSKKQKSIWITGFANW